MNQEDEIRALNEALLRGTLLIGESGTTRITDSQIAHECDVCCQAPASRSVHSTRYLCPQCRASVESNSPLGAQPMGEPYATVLLRIPLLSHVSVIPRSAYENLPPPIRMGELLTFDGNGNLVRCENSESFVSIALQDEMDGYVEVEINGCRYRLRTPRWIAR